MQKKNITGDIFISTMPLHKLIKQLKPTGTLKKEIRKLSFRSLITVNLILTSNPFPDQWIYVHDPKVKVGRIQNFRNWSPYMANNEYTPIGMEYFAHENDKLWNMDDAVLINLAKKELIKLGLAKRNAVVDAFVYRVKDAYPIYDFDYQTPLRYAREFLDTISNLYLCGRGGLFQYNNQDHSIYSGFLVGRNIKEGKRKYTVWDINNDGYLEEKS